MAHVSTFSQYQWHLLITSPYRGLIIATIVIFILLGILSGLVVGWWFTKKFYDKHGKKEGRHVRQNPQTQAIVASGSFPPTLEETPVELQHQKFN